MNVGDRVRIKLSGSADALDQAKGTTLGCHFRHLSAPVIGHNSEQDGRLGTIRECSGGFPCEFGSVLGHGYMVMYDAGYVFGNLERWGGHFAEDELELV